MEIAISVNIVSEYKRYLTDNTEGTVTTDSVETTRDPPEIGEDIVQPANLEISGHSNMMLDAKP